MRIRVPPNVVRVIAPAILDPLARSWHFRTRNADRWERLVQNGRPFIYLLWHEALLPLLWHHRRQQVAIVVSEARDGRYVADYAGRIGYRMVSGSSSRGGARALLGAIRALEGGQTIAITPDGPRGPRRKVKPGAVRAAQRTGAMILPLHVVTDSAWRFGSWDRLMVPKPFAKIDVCYGEPFGVSSRDELGDGIERCAAAMASIERELTD